MSETLFTTQTPSVDGTDGAPGITTATTIKFATAGSISAVRFYATATVGGTYTVGVWRVDSTDAGAAGTGTLLASKVLGSTPTGGTWNTVTLDSPVSVDTTHLYRVGMHNDTRYVATNNFFTGADLTNGNLTAYRHGADPLSNGWSLSQGTFAINAALTYPNQEGINASYFVDAVFDAGGTTQNGTVAQTDTFTGSVTGQTVANASAAQTDTFTGSVTASAPRGATASQTASFAGSVTGQVVANVAVTQALSVAGAATVDPGVVVPASNGNGWNSLLSIYRQNEVDMRRFLDTPITECPLHLYPLEPGRTPGTVHCKFGGHVMDLHGNPALI